MVGTGKKNAATACASIATRCGQRQEVEQLGDRAESGDDEILKAIKKGIESAKKNLRHVHTVGSTIPHQVLGRFGAGLVLLKPAPEGTGVIAGGPVRAVIQAAGISNVLTKSIGTTNPHNVVKATIAALDELRDRAQVAELRGIAVENL